MPRPRSSPKRRIATTDIGFATLPQSTLRIVTDLQQVARLRVALAHRCDVHWTFLGQVERDRRPK